MVVQLKSLRGELVAAGVFRHRELRSWIELVLMGAALAACLFGIARTGWIGALFFVPVISVLATSIAMMGHEGSHRSFSASPARNAILCYLVFPLFGSAFQLSYSLSSIIVAFVCSTVIGIAFGFLPARSASKLDPIEALARE